MRRSVTSQTDTPRATGSEREVMGRLGRAVSRVFAVGLAVSITLLLTGAILALAGREPSPSEVTLLRDTPGALVALEPGAFLDFGLLVLLATPVTGVVVLAAGFARMKSWVFFGFSVLVLGLLTLSAYLGLTG